MAANTKDKILIIKDKSQLYYDFITNLLLYVDKYYLDIETLSKDVDINNHYNFCYDKVCDEYEQEEIYLKHNTELRKYFNSYLSNQYYKVNNKVSMLLYISFWEEVFNNKTQRDKRTIAVLVELYEIFENNIIIGKNNIKKPCIIE